MATYYNVLGISSSATKEEIQKAYRTKAIENHPDRHRNDPSKQQEMKNINQAFYVLSDAERKSKYDLEKADKKQKSTNIDKEEQLPYFLPSLMKLTDQEYTLSLVDWAKGCDKTVQISKYVPCETCKEQGLIEPFKKQECCQNVSCLKCQGRGYWIPIDGVCTHCCGHGKYVKTVDHRIQCTPYQNIPSICNTWHEWTRTPENDLYAVVPKSGNSAVLEHPDGALFCLSFQTPSNWYSCRFQDRTFYVLRDSNAPCYFPFSSQRLQSLAARPVSLSELPCSLTSHSTSANTNTTPNSCPTQ